MIKIDIEQLRKDKYVFIQSGVGSGKSRFVEKKLFEHGNVLYINSRRSKVNQTLKNSEFSFGDGARWVTMTHAGLAKEIKSSTFPCIGYLEENGSGKMLLRPWSTFDFIVIDEAHCLVDDSPFADSVFHLKKFIEYIKSELPHICIVLMTATVYGLENTIDELGFKKYEFESNVLRKPSVKIISKDDVIQVLSHATQENRIAYMKNMASEVLTINHKLEGTGIQPENLAQIVAENNASKLKRKDLNAYQRAVRTLHRIEEDGILPDEIHLMVCTTKLKEGINIIDPRVKTVVIESHYPNDIIQFTGRFRMGVDTIYIVGDVVQHQVDAPKEVFHQEYDGAALEGMNAKLSSKNPEDRASDILLIEQEYNYIKYNHFSEKLEFFDQYQEWVKCSQMFIEDYRKNPVQYLKKVLGKEDVECLLKDNGATIKEIQEHIRKHYITSKEDYAKGDYRILTAKDKQELLEYLFSKDIRTEKEGKPIQRLNVFLKTIGFRIDRTSNSSERYVLHEI